MKTHTFRYFFIPYLLFLILGVMFISLSKHGDGVLWMNSLHNDFLNFFFRVWTYVGDWMVFAAIAIVLLIRKRRFGYIFLLIGAVQGLISWTLKQFFFDDTPRPGKYFEGQNVLDLVEGVELREFNSFPSGHTMTAFAMATFLTFVIARKEWAVILLIFAVLVGLSRLYLNQHFMIDVTTGSVIGVGVSLIAYKSFEKYLNKDSLKE
ncbi:MAG: phosphatase PAP2 family protein [Cyclobacteriaceae bacterium]